MLISENDFVGKFSIGQFSLNEELIKWYIINNERNFFIEYFTPTTYYDDLCARFESLDTTEKAAAEVEFAMIKMPLIAYIWLQYTTNEQEKLTGAGVTIEAENNARTVNMDIKCIRIWNDMIKVLKMNQNSVSNIIKTKLKYRNLLGL